jgi:hypothetical protein
VLARVAHEQRGGSRTIRRAGHAVADCRGAQGTKNAGCAAIAVRGGLCGDEKTTTPGEKLAALYALMCRRYGPLCGGPYARPPSPAGLCRADGSSGMKIDSRRKSNAS